jgi:holin-like protein
LNEEICLMLQHLALLMAFQFLGEFIVTLAGIPFPGPLCGMGLLLAYLHYSGGPSEPLAAVANTLVDHLGLMFVPAGAAIITYTTLLAREGATILAAVIVSTAAAILIAGLIAHRALPRPAAA